MGWGRSASIKSKLFIILRLLGMHYKTGHVNFIMHTMRSIAIWIVLCNWCRKTSDHNCFIFYRMRGSIQHTHSQIYFEIPSSHLMLYFGFYIFYILYFNGFRCRPFSRVIYYYILCIVAAALYQMWRVSMVVCFMSIL